MYEIRADEADILIDTIHLIKALKSIEQYKGEKLENINISIFDDDMYLAREENLTSLLDILVGNGNYALYTASEEEGVKVGYTLYYDEDELMINIIQILPKYYMKYMKILKKHNILPHEDRDLLDIACLVDDIYWNDYDLTESLLGKDYSGFYILTTCYSIDYEKVVQCLIEIEDYCKKRIIQYNHGIPLYINIGSDTKEKIKNTKKKRKRSWEKYREQRRWKWWKSLKKTYEIV